MAIDIDRRLDRFVVDSELKLVEVPTLVEEPSGVRVPRVVHARLGAEPTDTWTGRAGCSSGCRVILTVAAGPARTVRLGPGSLEIMQG